MNDFLDSGKIGHELFAEMIFPFCGAVRPEVKAGPQYGVDVSLIRLPNSMAMALTSDPLSLIPTLGLRESAWLSVHLMANDIATTGLAPMYTQLVLNLPPSLSNNDFKTYWAHLHEFCKDIDVAITGGHTGKAEGQHSTIAGGGTMITVGPEDQMLLSKMARPGDLIIVTKEAALIASSILALSFPKTVKDKCGKEVYERACDLFYETSSLQAALQAVGNNNEEKAVTAMHDVTEGGVLGAIYELATAAGCGAWIDHDSLPVGHAQQMVCALFGIDPLFCVGAGSMIITVIKDKAKIVLQRLAEAQIKATVVGEVREKEQGIIIHEQGKTINLEHPGTDPYWQAFFGAYKKGLT